jgi:hypothetical protein
LFLAAQSAKRSVEEALRSGDVQTARTRLASASELLTSADMDSLGAELASEVGWLNTTADMLDDSVAGAPPDIAYTTRRVSADRTRKSRGYKTRSQGGETTRGDSDDEV